MRFFYFLLYSHLYIDPHIFHWQVETSYRHCNTTRWVAFIRMDGGETIRPRPASTHLQSHYSITINNRTANRPSLTIRNIFPLTESTLVTSLLGPRVVFVAFVATSSCRRRVFSLVAFSRRVILWRFYYCIVACFLFDIFILAPTTDLYRFLCRHLNLISLTSSGRFFLAINCIDASLISFYISILCNIDVYE